MWQVFIQNEAGEYVAGSVKCNTRREANTIGNRKYGAFMFTIKEVKSSVVSNYRPPTAGM